MSILVVGSLVLDSIETPYGKTTDELGGSATYIAISSSYFSQDIKLVGVVGSDFGDHNLKLFAEKGIDTEGLEIVEGGKTFRWGGKYHNDMNSRDSLYTYLNVFGDFNPVIPDSYKQAQFVCLGNIDPVLQKSVLEQIRRPKLVICDTMNFWIEGKLEELKETLKLVDVLIVNDSEAKLLSGNPNLVKSARIIREMGPKTLIIKKGEHGALLFTDNSIFTAPAFPLEEIFDPTGAGDTFAGGFVGYLAKCGEVTEYNLRKAVVYGSTMASFCVEKFGTSRLNDLSQREIDDRFNSFLDLSRIDE